MTDYLRFDQLKIELLNKIRNANIFSVTTREVTTTTATGTFSSTSNTLINRPDVKNIRSIVVGATTLTYGTDYTINPTYNDSGTQKCLISFVAAQTGAYTITYDYGTDHIFGDYPRAFLTLAAFPRMTVDFGPSPTRVGGMGEINETDIFITVTLYDLNTTDIESYEKSVREYMLANAKNFYYLPSKYISPSGRGTTQPYSNSNSDSVKQLTLEFKSPFNYEKNN